MEAGRVVRGRLRVPGSKSASHRHLNLALLASRPVVLEGLLEADDIGHFLHALERLGWRHIPGKGAEMRLEPPGTAPERASLFAGNAGTLCRFLVASLATMPGRWVVDGAPRLRERPVGALVDALRQLGASIRYRGGEGFPPVEIHGGTLQGGTANLDSGVSSQYLSAVVMAALAAPEATTVSVKALASAPYVDLTLRAVEQWGGRVDWDGRRARVRPGLTPPERIRIPGDDSAAAYPAAAAVLTGGAVELAGLDRDSGHGDRRFLKILERMGGIVVWDVEGALLRVEGRDEPLRAVDEDMGDVPDQVPTLAALAPFARGTTRIRNVGHLRIKESDRLAAMARELGRLGVTVEEGEDSLVIEGSWADRPPPSDPVTVDTWDDHRIAMSLALLGLRRPGVVIGDAGVVGKSYPGFWDDLESLLA